MTKSVSLLKRGRVLVAAGLATLAFSAGSSFQSRQSLLDAQWLVTHTNEVKLEIAAARLALARGDREGLRAAERRVTELTVTNPRVQQKIGHATALRELGADDATLDATFVDMDAEEKRLLDERAASLTRAQQRDAGFSGVALAFSLAFCAGALRVHRRQRAELKQQRRLIGEVVDNVDEGIVAISPSGEVIAFNSTLRAMIGAPNGLAHVGEHWTSSVKAVLEDGSELTSKDAPITKALGGVVTTKLVYQLVRRDGSSPPIWAASSARPVFDEDGKIVAAVSTIRNITAQVATHHRLEDLSMRDEMTGLLNRRGLIENAKKPMEMAKAQHKPLAVLFADLNGLKRINDELGHEEGDRAIKDTADVLREALRPTDIIARLGGDEFVVVLPNLKPEDAEKFIERITRATTKLGEDRGRAYRLSLSAGISFMDGTREQTIEEVIVEADQRMYSQKRNTSTSFLRLAHSA